MDHNSSTPLFWWKIEIERIPAADRELLIGQLYADECLGLEETSESSLTAYFGHHRSEEEAKQDLIDPLKFQFPAIQATLSRQDKENWLDNWKANFHPIRFPGKYGIRAPWHPLDETEPSIVIEPNFAFGTGHHESTRIILHLLERSWVEHLRILDIGCGSGILSFASALLGAESVVGIDNDCEAILYADKNRVEYNPGLPIRFETAEPDRIDWNFEGILMNIITSGQYPILEKIAQRRWQWLMVSGILIDEKKEYLEWVAKIGLKPVQEWMENEWIGFILIRN